MKGEPGQITLRFSRVRILELNVILSTGDVLPADIVHMPGSCTQIQKPNEVHSDTSFESETLCSFYRSHFHCSFFDRGYLNSIAVLRFVSFRYFVNVR